MAVRQDDWKLVFLEQRAHQFEVWAEPFVELRVPKILNLRRDPFERAPVDSDTYFDWLLDHAVLLVPAQGVVMNMAKTLVEYPPRQKPASFNLDGVLETLTNAAGAGAH